MLPVCGVVYGFGAVSPLDILAAAGSICEVVLIVSLDDPHNVKMLPVLRALAPTVVVERRETTISVDGTSDFEFRGITTFSEEQIELTSVVAARLGLPYHSSEESIRLRDKAAQRTALADAGLPVPDAIVIPAGTSISDVEFNVQYPAVLKPRFGSGSRATICVEAREDIQFVLESIGSAARTSEDFVLESLIRGITTPGREWLAPYISVDLAQENGVVLSVVVAERLPLIKPFREGGLILPASLDPRQQQNAIEVAGQAVRACSSSSGLFHVELILTESGWKVIEVNGRPGGPVHKLMGLTTRVNVARMSLEIALGIGIAFNNENTSVAMFQQLAPPMGASSLTRGPDIAALRAVDGVENVEVHVRPGGAVDWRDGTPAAIVSIWSLAKSHDGIRLIAQRCCEIHDQSTEYA